MRKSFSLVEVLVASVILATVLGGLLATFITVRKYVTRSNKRQVSMNLDRGGLNRLFVAVRADEWGPPGAGNLSTAIAPSADEITVIDNLTYTGNYTVLPVPGNDYRQVIFNVTHEPDAL